MIVAFGLAHGLEVTRINHKNIEAVILAMKAMLARHEIPEKIIADNIPFNSLRFKDFARVES